MVAVSLKKRRWVSPFRNLRVKFFFKQKTAYEINRVTGVQTCALPILLGRRKPGAADDGDQPRDLGRLRPDRLHGAAEVASPPERHPNHIDRHRIESRHRHRVVLVAVRDVHRSAEDRRQRQGNERDRDDRLRGCHPVGP